MNEPQTPDLPSAGVQMLTLLVCFLGGPIGSVYLTHWVAPTSELVPAMAGLLTGAVLFFGFFFWLGLAFLSLFTRSGRNRVHTGLPPKGTTGFVWTGVIAGLLLGLATGIVSERLGFFAAFGLLFGAQAAYGYLLHRLARAGYLPFIEEVG